MPLHKGKIRGIFIKVIFIYPRHQATHYVKLTLMISHTASAVDYLLNGMTGKFSERSSIVNIHPRICLTDRLIEIGRASCRERVESSVGAVAIKRAQQTH